MALTQTQSDNFTRANESPLSDGGKWGVMTGLGQPDLTSDLVQPHAINAAAVTLWTGNAWANDQYSEITVHFFTGTNTTLYPVARGATGAITMYVAKMTSGTTIKISVFNAGTETVLLSVTTAAINPGDKIAISAVGTQITAFLNRVVVAALTDSSIASGNAGLGVYSAANAVTSAQLSAWNGGTATATSLVAAGGLLTNPGMTGGVSG